MGMQNWVGVAWHFWVFLVCLVLWGRACQYHPGHLDEWMHQDGQFFAHGGWLAMYPMADLPLYRVDAQRRQHASHYAEPKRS